MSAVYQEFDKESYPVQWSSYCEFYVVVFLTLQTSMCLKKDEFVTEGQRLTLVSHVQS